MRPNALIPCGFIAHFRRFSGNFPEGKQVAYPQGFSLCRNGSKNNFFKNITRSSGIVNGLDSCKIHVDTAMTNVRIGRRTADPDVYLTFA